ncbi:MAG: hypothetical protein HY319_19070 [Armatimonadetes bacterium]|nr:hypothetical protein [Armatimonadota bacterium]
MLESLEHIRQTYGLDARTFAALYAVFHVFLFYAALGLAVVQLRRRRRGAALAWAGTAGACYLVPYGYVLAAGRDLPWTVHAGLGGLLALSCALLARKLLRVFRQRSLPDR